MQLVNQTPAPATVDVSLGEDDAGPRIGMLVAKVTFNILAGGRTEVETQDPIPLFGTEEPTDLGPLPSDGVQRRDSRFEVIMLGAAYTPHGRLANSCTVGLQVGEVAHSMVVTGDRAWARSGKTTQISRPAPFHRMPLTYANAHGGSCDTNIDLDTVVELRDRLNPHGKGFDAEAQAIAIAAGFKAPQGFPHLDYTRLLPNLEHPEQRITRWEDAPEPYCWATVPQDTAFSQIRMLRRMDLLGKLGRTPEQDEHPPTTEQGIEQLYHRAHPDWIIDLPGPQTLVTMTGLTPEGRLAFHLPPVRVLADYTLGERRGCRELAPQVLVLLPEERRGYLVYRSAFTVETQPGVEQSFRLRLDRGWFQYPEPQKQ
ncbi:MAG: DUF2169 domain-containing protein [Nannocystaceae bacterium]|nr:DUF2169 domain-containing protein [Nannocystaceae bacterium]